MAPLQSERVGRKLRMADCYLCAIYPVYTATPLITVNRCAYARIEAENEITIPQVMILHVDVLPGSTVTGYHSY
jgi:hypothetical protein